MGCSIPVLPVPHHLPKFAQVHVYCISGAIQSSHPVMPSSPSALNLSQHQGIFQWVGCSLQMTKILELQLQHHSFQWIFWVDLPSDWLGWSPCYPREFQESSSAPQFEGINFLAFCLLHSPALTTTGKTIALTIRTFVSRVMFLCFLIHCLGLSSLSCQEAIIFCFHGCSQCLQWFWSPRRGNITTSTFSLSICHAIMGPDAMILVSF